VRRRKVRRATPLLHRGHNRPAWGWVFGLSATVGRALSLVSVLVVCGVLGEAVARKYRPVALVHRS